MIVMSAGLNVGMMSLPIAPRGLALRLSQSRAELSSWHGGSGAGRINSP